MLVTYLPHPFLVVSALLIGVGWWAFASLRKRVKKPHPKTFHAIRLSMESLLYGLVAFGGLLAARMYGGQPLDGEFTWIAIVFGLSLSMANFMCPYMGYNFFGNTKLAYAMWPFIVLILASSFLILGVKAQFGL
jgi:hypothetical protein